MTQSQHDCPLCDTAVPAGHTECPGCHTELALCGSPECGQLYPRDAPCCSFCGWKAESLSSTAAAPTDRVSPSGQDVAGIEGPVSNAAATAQAGPTSFDEFLSLFQQDTATAAAQGDPGPVAVPKAVPGVGLAAVPFSPPMAAKALHAPDFPSPNTLVPAVQAGGAAGLPVVGRPGMFTDLVGVAAGTGSYASAVLEVESSQKYRRGQQGLLRLRTRSEGLDGDTVVEFTAVSGLLASPMAGNTRIGPMETCELAAMRFVPRVAGSDHIRFSMTLKTVTNVPIGRWTGSWVVNIEEAEKSSSPINAGGDVFIMGGMPINPTLPGLDASFGGSVENWQRVPLQPDLAFNRRLANICPQSDLLPPPRDPGSSWPVGARAQGAVQLRDEHTGVVQTLAVVCGMSASFGRGGDPAVAWWLQPSPYDAHQHGRLSRRHLSLELRNGRAWVTDWSTNGTWLNGERLSRPEPHLLAQDDRLEPAQVLPLRIRLLTYENRVHAILLQRSDALGDRLCYLMTDGQVPVPVPMSGQEVPALWVTWRRTPTLGPEILACLAEGGPWSAIGHNQERVIAERFRLRWLLLPSPVDQAAYLDGLT